jgi:glucokinase
MVAKTLESLVLAVDLGGTNFRLALVNPAGEIVHRSSRPTSKGEGTKIFVRQLAAAMLELTAAAGISEAQVQAVGMGIPGQVERDQGRVVKAPNIPELDQVGLGPALAEMLPWPVALDNDANLFAWGEAAMGAGRGEQNLLGITLGTGVGGGLVLGGKLWQGSKGTAAEIGHLTIEPGGERCNCGNQGCLETLASATWTVKWTVAQLAAGAESSLQPLWQQNPRELTAHRIYQAAAAGDRLAQKSFHRVGRALGQAIAGVVHLLGIPLIILGGNFAQAWEQFIPSLEMELDNRLTFFPRADLSLRPAVLGDNAGLLGAARLAWDLARGEA